MKSESGYKVQRPMKLVVLAGTLLLQNVLVKKSNMFE
jgi:hypothetical protein